MIIVDLNRKWLRVYNEENDDNATMEDITTWEMGDHVKNGDALYAIIERPGFFDDLDPLPGAIAGFKALRNSGHEVRVVTSPSCADSARAKITWCEKHLSIPKNDVMIVHDKWWLNLDAIVDDKPATIRKCAESMDVYTIAYPYNKDVADLCKVYAEDYKNTEKAWAEIVSALT